MSTPQSLLNLADFQKRVQAAPVDKDAERFVRIMLEEIAKGCPMSVLVALGQCLIDCRKAELKAEGDSN
jgi:hypothetical protein